MHRACVILMCYTVSEGGGDHTQTIRQHYVFMLEHLDVFSLLDELYQAKVLTDEEMNIISLEAIRISRVAKLLSVLSRKTREQFDKFLDVVDKVGYEYIVDHVTGRQGQ